MPLLASSHRIAKLSGLDKFLFVLPLIALLAWAPSKGFARGTPDGFADLAQRLLPSVVTIETSQKAEKGKRDMDPNSISRRARPSASSSKNLINAVAMRRVAVAVGSGFIISADGYVVTNNHVIENADAVEVVLNDDQRLDGKIIGKDPKTDLALVKVVPKSPLTPVAWGNSKTARIGDWVVAIGNPLGLGGTVTAGSSRRAAEPALRSLRRLYATDAPINRGNSGGPLFDLEAVIGVNTAILSPSGGSIGIGFAIPSSLAEGVIQQLKEFGTTKRGWLGVQIQTVTDEIAESLGLNEAKGALVAGVVDDSPAAAASSPAMSSCRSTPWMCRNPQASSHRRRYQVGR